MDKLAKESIYFTTDSNDSFTRNKISLLLSLGIAAFHGWQYLGSTIYFSVKDTKGI